MILADVKIALCTIPTTSLTETIELRYDSATANQEELGIKPRMRVGKARMDNKAGSQNQRSSEGY